MKTTLLIARASSSGKDAADVRRLLLQTGLREAGIPLAEVDRIGHSPDGKPFLPGYPGFHFNLSHSGDYIACIFSEAGIGLDLQEHRQPGGRDDRLLRIARRFFTAGEYTALLTLQADSAAHRPLQSGPAPEKHVIPQDGVGDRARQQQDDAGEGAGLQQDDAGEGTGQQQDGPEAPATALFYRLWTIKEAYLKYIGCGLRGSMNSFRPSPLPLEPPAASVFSQPGRPSVRGKIEILKDTDLLRPAAYLLLPAMEGYSMTICAEEIPAEICTRLL